MKIPVDKVQWSILPSVQEFLLGGTDNPDSIDFIMQSMVDNIVELCAMNSRYGCDWETCNKINNIMSNCSDVYELLKAFKQDMAKSVEN